MPSGRATALQVVGEIRFLEPLHDQALQRKQRQEHVGVQVGDDARRRDGRPVGEVARAEQALSPRP